MFDGGLMQEHVWKCQSALFAMLVLQHIRTPLRSIYQQALRNDNWGLRLIKRWYSALRTFLFYIPLANFFFSRLSAFFGKPRLS